LVIIPFHSRARLSRRKTMGELLLGSSAEAIYVHSLSGDCRKLGEVSSSRPHADGGTTSILFSHDARVIFSAGNDGTIAISKLEGTTLGRLPKYVGISCSMGSISVILLRSTFSNKQTNKQTPRTCVRWRGEGPFAQRRRPGVFAR